MLAGFIAAVPLLEYGPIVPLPELLAGFAAIVPVPEYGPVIVPDPLSTIELAALVPLPE